MKVKVNKSACIGCGACTAICPEVFELDDDGIAKTLKEKVEDDNKPEVVEAKEGCPTGAIETTE